MRNKSDFEIINGGSVLLVQPNTPDAVQWIEDNIGSENGFQPYYPTLCVEPRYIGDIVEGIQSEGFYIS